MEYELSTDRKSKESKATNVKLIERVARKEAEPKERPRVNEALISTLKSAQEDGWQEL